MIDKQDLVSMDDDTLKATLKSWGIDSRDVFNNMMGKHDFHKEREADYIVSDEYFHMNGIPAQSIASVLAKNRRRSLLLRQDEAFLGRILKLLCPNCNSDKFCHTHSND